jgi:mannan endo-1,4-beta-mannosidase
VTEPSSTDEGAEDWGWENNESCVLPGTPTYEGKTECETHVETDYSPPELTGTLVADGFHTSGGQLLDAYGEEFIIRGVNNPHIWADIGGAFDAYKALDDIAVYGTNTIRVVWETSGEADMLAQILFRIVQLRMVPMVELHDETGATNSDGPLRMAEYYTREEVLEVLQQFRAYLLINIANEWNGQDFAGAYSSAIAHLRDSGVVHTLVIDANDWGQNVESIFANAASLIAGDPEQNLVFSVHMYELFGDAGTVESTLSRDPSIPLIVGEFGDMHNGQPVAWDAILSAAESNGRGYIAWSWYGNDAQTSNLNLVDGWGGSLTAWGRNVMQAHPASISNTSVRASIFD